MLQQHKKKRKQNGQTFCKYYYNIFCHLFILFAGVCECVGVCGVCAGYFIIFAGCMIINLHLNHRHRRPCRADDWPVQFLLFFPPAWHFFSGLLFCLRSTFWAPLQTVCVCVCGYTHNIINHKVSHDFILTPDLPPSLLPAGCTAAPALAWLQLAGLYFWGRAALRDFRR